MPALAGKVAVITGAAKGQGEAEARLFAREGARVVLTDVLADVAEEVAADIGDTAVAVAHDVTDPEGWTRVVDVARQAFGGLDVLVNNAGIHWIRPLADERPEDIERMLAVNLVGPFLGTQTVIEPMRERGGGSIVNISSLAGLQGVYGHGAYGASKWGLRGLTKTAAVELGPLGIRVNSVHPGPIDTDMMPIARDQVASRFRSVPLARVGQPEEVAELVLFLASDASSYLSGAEIAIDGGMGAGRLPVRGDA